MAAVAVSLWIAYYGGWSRVVFGLHGYCGCRVRTPIRGSRRVLAVRTCLRGCISLLATSHTLNGVQISTGCVRTLVVGCRKLMAGRRFPLGYRFAYFYWVAVNLWLLRTSFMGCRCLLAAFAVFLWVADDFWLPGTQFFFGLQEGNGCWDRTVSMDCSSFMAAVHHSPAPHLCFPPQHPRIAASRTTTINRLCGYTHIWL